jgi:hypothetical protein
MVVCSSFIEPIGHGMPGKFLVIKEHNLFSFLFESLINLSSFENSTKLDSLRSPIASDTVMVVNASNGDLIHSWGANQ